MGTIAKPNLLAGKRNEEIHKPNVLKKARTLVVSSPSAPSFDPLVRANMAAAQQTGAPVLERIAERTVLAGPLYAQRPKDNAFAARAYDSQQGGSILRAVGAGRGGRTDYVEKPTFSAPKLAGGMVLKGVDNAMEAVASSADLLIGKNIQNVGTLFGQDWSNNPISALNQRIKQGQAQNRTHFQENVQNGGKAAEVIDRYGTAAVAAVPQALLALATAGGSTAQSGLSAISTAAQAAPGLASSLKSVSSTLAKDPKYWLSFLQTTGSSYDAAIADGSGDMKAGLFALSNGLLNAAVEVSGGIDTLPTELNRGSASALKLWISSMVDEGKEEVVQGAIERGLQNLVYQKNNPALSLTDPNAIFSPKTAAEEFTGGAVVGGLLGGGQMLAGNTLRGAAWRGAGAETANTVNPDTVAPGVNGPQSGGKAPLMTDTVDKMKKPASEMETARTAYDPIEAFAIRHEGKTFRNLVAGFDSTISEFFHKWEHGRKSHQGEKLEKLYIAKMPENVRKQVEEIVGYPVPKRDFIFTNDDVKHVFDQHGNPETEVKRGNVPLGDWAFDALPNILTNPDSIVSGHEGRGKNAGKTGVRFEKELPNGRVVCIQFDNSGRDTMSVATIYAKKSTTSVVTASKEADTRTFETTEPVLYENSIAPSPQKSKGDGTDALTKILLGGKRVDQSTLIYGQEKSPASASDRSAKNNPQNTVAGTELFTERDVGPVANAERVNIDRGTITPSRNTVSQAIGNSKGETASGVLLTKDGVKLGGTADVEEPLIKPTIIKKPDVVQKNTASGMETVENSRLTDADAATYFQIGEREHVRNLKKEMNRNGDIPILSTRSKIMEFIQDSAIGKIQNAIKAYGLVGKRFQSDVAAKSRGTTDISGYYLELDSNRISHLSDHLNEDGDERNIPLSKEQLISVPDYIDNYDDLLNVVTRKDGQTRIYLGKKINGHSVIIVLASKGRKSIQPVTAWQNTTEQYMKKYGKKMDTTVTSQNPTEAGNERGYHPAPMNSVTPPSENSKGNDRRIKKDSGSEPFKTGMTAKNGMTGVQNQLSTHNVAQAIGNSKGEVASGVLLTKDGVKLGDTMRPRGTDALDKLGVRPVGDMGKYDNADFLRGANQAKKNSKRELQKALARLDPTPGEREFSRGIANGLYAEANIPPNMSVDTVTELADYYRADSSYNQESGIEIRKASIREQTEQKAAELFKDAERYKPISMLVMNERTPERIMRSVFGMERGEAINQEYIYPVQSNEAKKMRFLNRMVNTVRTFTDSNGERSALTQPERAITQQLLEDRFVGESVASMETAGAIRSAAENIKNGKDSADEAREFGLGAEERGLAEQLARWMKNQELLQSGALDSVKLNNAVEKYAGQFDLFYDAVNDFLVAHGYDAIGFIKGYAPHMQGVDTQNRLLSALKSMGVNTDASSLPTSISGLTADYKPGKRWNPFFQSRVGTKTDYDIAKAYESYVGYMADVLYHTDDIARLRAVSRYLRKTYGSEELFHAIDHAESLRHTSLETQLEVLRDAKKISAGTTLSWEDTKAQMDSYIDELYEDVQHMQKYGELVKYIDNYANILAGKQSMADRGMEYTAGRTGLNAGNKLVAAFARAQVAGNVSSVLNQAAQLPMILSEVDGKYIRSAAAELAQKTGGKLWNIKKTELFDQSDLLTSKMGIEYLTADDTAAGRLATTLFKPADIMDGLISALAVQSKYDQLIADGKNHEVAMTEANRFATGIMASRAKGSRPLAFESKSLVSQMLHMFQVEALNGWEHLSQDLPTQYQETARQYGKKAGARAVAMVATKGLLAAFLMNRITEAAYGGTPAPFDILGFISNFIASGKGMSTNAWLENLVNAGWQALFGTPLFGAGDDEDKEKKPFVWKRAFGDLGYNIMNEVPFARNATGLLGLGDQSMPLANIADSVKGVGQAVKNAGIFSDEMGGAMLDLGSQLLPGGRQLQKTAQGIQTLANSGRVYGYGDKKRLQYPVEKTPGNIAQALLFGNSGLSESRDFYASGDSGFTAKQTGLLRDMTQAGGDIVTLYQAVQEIRKEESTEDKMRTLDEAELSDKEKLKIYAGVIATSESKRPEIFRELMEKQKFSWNQVSEAYTLYLELNNADMAATEKATRFSRWADEIGLSSTQRATLKDALPFYSQARAEATRYSQLVEGGLKPNVAEALALRLSGLQPKRGKETVSDLQRYQAVAEYGLSEKTQMAALESLMGDKEYEKIESLYRSGISPKKYFAFEEEAAKLVSDKDRNGKTVSGSRKRKVLAAMNAMDLTTGQKDALYYAEGYAKSTLHDAPWYVHVERLDEALPAPRLAGPILVKPTLTRDIMPKLTK